MTPRASAATTTAQATKPSKATAAKPENAKTATSGRAKAAKPENAEATQPKGKAAKSSRAKTATSGNAKTAQPSKGKKGAAKRQSSAPKRRRESAVARKERARRIDAALAAMYPDAHCALDFTNPLELTVATILSAQCTDARVNSVTPALFRRYPTAADYAMANPEELEEIIHSTGFFRAKARNIIGLGQALVERHGGEVPGELEALVKLPGVGRKTANVVLGNAFGVPGITVDTHCGRLARRLGLTAEEDPVKVEADLGRLIEQPRWTQFSHAIIAHGRQVCHSRKAACGACFLQDLCPSAGVAGPLDLNAAAALVKGDDAERLIAAAVAGEGSADGTHNRYSQQETTEEEQ